MSLVMEYLPYGSLIGYLENNRHKVNTRRMLLFASQICKVSLKHVCLNSVLSLFHTSRSPVWSNVFAFPGDGVPAVPALCAQRPRSQKHPGGQRVAGENWRFWAYQDHSVQQGILPGHTARRESHLLVWHSTHSYRNSCTLAKTSIKYLKSCRWFFTFFVELGGCWL